jgi:predicted RND superfamily exporter protein
MVLLQFFPTIYFGLLTGLAMFAALIGALFLLPKLILLWRPFKVPAPASF